MLGKIILFVLQIVIAWLIAPILHNAIRVPGEFSIFLYAILFAIIVFLVGVLGAQVLQDVGGPSGATLSAALVGALIVAALIFFLPDIVRLIPARISDLALVLTGALIGYWIKR